MKTIKDWALDDRPREKMIAKGAESLSNAELMAILIGSGIPGISAVDLMRQILGDYNDSLKLLGRATLKDLMKYKGMGEAKAITVLAACQLAQRRLSENVHEKKRISSSRDVYDFFLPLMQDLSIEECHLLLLRQNLTVIGETLLSKGGITGTAVDIRLAMKRAILSDAPVVALCHNHPSGSTNPSTQDDHLTHELFQACRLMNIHLLDHVILADGDFYSYSENGRLQ